MADNTELNAGSGGDIIASDDIAGVKIQRIKIVEGADGSNDGDISAANPLPVDVSDSASRDLGKVDIAAFDVALPSGTNAIGKLAANSGVDIGDVDVLSCALPSGASTAAKQPALGTAGTASSDVITVQGITSMTPLLATISGTVTANAGTGTLAVSLASVPSHAVTNAGTFATQESGAALTALQLIDNVVVTHDATVSAAGNQMMGSALTTNPTAVATGDAVRIMCDDQGRVVTSPHSVRDLVGIQQTNLANQTETTIVTAAASTFHDIVGFTIHNGGSALNQVTIRDSTAGTTRFVFQLAADGGGTVFTPCVPIPQATVNNNWTAQASVTGDVDITALYIKRT